MSDDAKLYRCMGGRHCTHTPGTCTATNTEYQAKANAECQAKTNPYTVIFYVDGDYAVETFVERVKAANPSAAFDAAVQQAIGHRRTSTGRSLSESDYKAATEIAIFEGSPSFAH